MGLAYVKGRCESDGHLGVVGGNGRRSNARVDCAMAGGKDGGSAERADGAGGINVTVLLGGSKWLAIELSQGAVVQYERVAEVGSIEERVMCSNILLTAQKCLRLCGSSELYAWTEFR